MSAESDTVGFIKKLKTFYWRIRKGVGRRIKTVGKILCGSSTTQYGNFKISGKPKRIRSKSASQGRYYSSIKEYLPIDEKMILFESFSGLGMNDNPFALFLSIIKNPQYKGYKFVWVVDSLEEQERLKKRFKNINIIYVVRCSDIYLKYLGTAKYIINNILMPLYFSKREGQVFVYTWHSITLKYLGYDILGGKLSVGIILSNMLNADYIISANAFMTKVFRESFRLDGIYEGTFIEEGYPRNDLLINADKNSVLDILDDYGIKVDRSKKIIVYAPTWKGKSTGKPTMETDKYIKTRDEILKNIDTSKYQVLIKPHQAVFKKLSPEELQSGIYIPATMDTNQFLSVADILISDYSSIAFDYMHTDRPTLFYIPDIKQYSKNRGIYFTPDELPGPATSDLTQIIYWINNIDKFNAEYGQKYAEFKKWVCEHDDGKASDRIVDCIFNKKDSEYRTYKVNKTDKKKLCIYGGGFKENGVTSTLLYRLHNLDYDKFDVTLIAAKPASDFSRDALMSLNDNVRLIVRTGGMASTKTEYELWKEQKTKPFENHKIDPILMRMFKREYMRAFGNSKFDYLIDYSGYGPRFACMLLVADSGKKFVWQHTDVSKNANDSDKTSQESYTEQSGLLKAIVSLYPNFDKIVSAGKLCMEVNKKCLNNPLNEGKYTYAPNLIGYEEIKQKLNSLNIVQCNNEEYYLDVCEGLVGKVKNSFVAKFVPLPRKGCTNFVTMGRLSSEKNCVNLLTAFKAIHDKNPDVTLTFIGSGDLERQLKDQAKELKIRNDVFFVGQLANPIAYISMFQCFIFPSRYEGSGASVYEARIVGIPIILTNYATHLDVCCGETGQIVTEMDADSIAAGMEQFLSDPQKIHYNFDVEKFNEDANKRFYGLFD